jgi:hypothetical protein
MTRADLLTHSISFALIGASKTVRGLSTTLTDEERMAVARAVVDELRRHGDQWRLDEEIESPVCTHSTPISFTKAHKQER